MKDELKHQMLPFACSKKLLNLIIRIYRRLEISWLVYISGERDVTEKMEEVQRGKGGEADVAPRIRGSR